MRVLHVIPYMHPSAGGPPVVVENFVRETLGLGHESEVVTTAMLCRDDATELLQRLNRLAPTSFLPGSPALAPWSGAAQAHLRSRVQAADIVHVHTLWSPINVAVRRECARQGRPYVLMPHGMLDPYSLSVRRLRKALYLRTVEGRNIAGARRMMFTTMEEARLAALSWPSLPQNVVVPLAGDAPGEGADALASRFLEQHPVARDRRLLLFLGRLHFKKGLDRILAVLPEIAGRFPDVLLAIVGDGAPAFAQELRADIARRGMERHVLMTGRLDGLPKWGAYAAAELFLLPSRQENFALTVAEAMHMGVPVIVGNRVNTWPYVRDAGAGLVLEEEGIAAALARAIASLLADRAGAAAMGRRGRNYARENLTWSAAAKRLIRCYQEVLAVS